MLGVVIVNYLSDSLTARFVREELSKIKIPYVAVIVNNGATESSSSKLESETGVKVITAANGGYAKGNNIGARYLKEKFNPEYILFSNNDIAIGEGDVVGKLVSRLSDLPSSAIIGPEVIGLDGRRQGPEPYIGPWNKFVFMYLSTPFLSKARKRKVFSLDYSENAQEGTHYKLSGCFFLVRSRDFFSVGMFDENTFLYAEENILSDRFSAINKTLYFYPSVQIVHEHGKTISRTTGRKKMAMLQFESMSYYYSAYRGYPRFVMRIIGFVYWIIETLKG